ncbi:hypothetical protein E4U54_003926 [Claviceps lovelessii]|nr:hypothetical protein E4U54_003926 [Claviceps lovelessii]
MENKGKKSRQMGNRRFYAARFAQALAYHVDGLWQQDEDKMKPFDPSRTARGAVAERGHTQQQSSSHEISE